MKTLLLEQAERFKKECFTFKEDQSLARIAYNQGRVESVKRFIEHYENIVRETESKE